MTGLPLLLVQLLAVIVTGRALARVLRTLGQPAVIAEILAGIALGPSLLGSVAPSASAALFPASSMAGLSLVSQFALVLFMFLVGLEFDPRLLRGRLRSSLFVSQSSIVVPFVSGAALAGVLFPRFAPPGVPLLSFALFLGAAMSVTAFPVLARILAERGMVRTEVGAVSLACAAVDDVTAWCLLAFVVAVAESTGLAGAAVTAALTVAYLAVLAFGVAPLLRPLGPRAGADLSPELLAGLFVALFASAFITEWIGVHALFGAFLFGAVLPREGGLGPALAARLEDVVTVVLLPLFFAYSGLRTKIGLLDDAESWLACAAVVVVAVGGKLGGGAFAARLTGASWREAGTIGVLMNTRGLMELVVLNVGLDIGVISDRVFAMMVVMALVTTWMTSPLVDRLWPRARVEQELPGPPAQPLALLCVSDPAIARAMLALADALHRADGGELLAVHVTPVDRPSVYLRDDEGPSSPGPLPALRSGAAAKGVPLRALSLAGSEPVDELARVAAATRAPLVLVGAQRAALGGPASGAVAQLLGALEATVAIVSDRGLERVSRVVLAGEDAASHAFAERLARGAGASVEVRTAERGDVVVAPLGSAGDDLGYGAASAVVFVRGASTRPTAGARP